MSYQKAEQILPAHLLKEIQKYVDGGYIYIPKLSKKIGWGYLSGARESLVERNRAIIDKFKAGVSISKLADEFYLSEQSIKKIVYGSKKEL